MRKMSLSRKTIAALAGLLANGSHSSIDALFYRYGVEARDDPGNREKRAILLVQAIEKKDEGERQAELFDLIEHALRNLCTGRYATTAWHESDDD
jgi:hypothetical protein